MILIPKKNPQKHINLINYKHTNTHLTLHVYNLGMVDTVSW